MPSNPQIILSELNRQLSEPVEITIFGASALSLGFGGSVGDQTRDVDLLIPARDIPRIEANEDFWKAQQRLNEVLADQGLYMTHIFEDKQVVLTKDWADKRVPIALPEFSKLTVFRPAVGDLILTKMMRNDPEDRSHIQFLLQQQPHSDAQLLELYASAQLPDVEEIQSIFCEMKAWVRYQAQQYSQDDVSR